MARVKRGVHHSHRRRNILRKVKGYKWGRKSKLKLAQTAILKAGRYAYNDRRKKKGEFRKLWTLRINAAVREHGMTYSRFINALKISKVELDRKVLADLAMNHPLLFKAVVEKVKK